MKLAVLGCGKMAQAIVLGNKDSFLNKDLEFHGYTPSKTKARELALAVQGSWYSELADLAQCDYYLLGCKPQNFDQLAGQLAPIIKNIKGHVTIISILAGIKTETIFNKLGVQNIVRVMPNTPCMIGMGMTALYFSKGLENNQKNFIESFFSKVSKVRTFEEENWIDQITPFSGSGPAYVFELVRILSEKLSSAGLPYKEAQDIIAQTFLGSIELLNASDETAEELRDNVTSKKGITFEALEVLKSKKLEDTFGQALDKAYKRALEISEGNI